MKVENFEAAVHFYGKAIELNPANAVYFCNRYARGPRSHRRRVAGAAGDAKTRGGGATGGSRVWLGLCPFSSLKDVTWGRNVACVSDVQLCTRRPPGVPPAPCLRPWSVLVKEKPRGPPRGLTVGRAGAASRAAWPWWPWWPWWPCWKHTVQETPGGAARGPRRRGQRHSFCFLSLSTLFFFTFFLEKQC